MRNGTTQFRKNNGGSNGLTLRAWNLLRFPISSSVVRNQFLWLIACLVFVNVVLPIAAQTNTSFQYFYDDLGQLTKVVDSTGTVVEYVYDPVGNILQIKRSTVAAGSLAIFNFTPQRGGLGETVTLEGQGFGATPADNSVQFNGTAATVISATPTILTVTVPAAATTGPISVTVAGQTAKSATSFTVLPLPVITSLSRKSALFNTTFPNVVVTGINFSGASFAFQPLGVMVTAAAVDSTGTSAVLALKVGSSAGTFALVATNEAGSSSAIASPNNRFTVVNPLSTAISASGIPDVVEAISGADPLDPNGAPNPSLPPSGEIHAMVFSVLNTAGSPNGQAVTLESDGVPFSTLNLAGVTGNQRLRMETNSAPFSVLNSAGSGNSQPVPFEADGAFSVLNIAAVTSGNPVSMEADAVVFSVNNTNPNAPRSAQSTVALHRGGAHPTETHSARKTPASAEPTASSAMKALTITNDPTPKEADSVETRRKQ